MAEGVMLAYLAYLTSLGAAWINYFGFAGPWKNAPLSWSFCLGTIIWAYSQFILDCLSIPSHGGMIFVWQAFILALPLVLVHFKQDSPNVFFKPEQLFRGKGKIFIVLVGIAFFTALFQALAFPMHMWDSIVIYGFKAKILSQEQTFKTPAFLDASVLHFSADYPLLISYLEAGFYRWLGHSDDRIVRLLFLAYWSSWLGVIYGALRERLRLEHARMWLALIATLPLFSNIFMGQAVSGFADIPFGLYWTTTLLCGLSATQGESGLTYFLWPFFAVGCIFTKNEGIPAVLLGGGLFLIFCKPPNRGLWMRALIYSLLLILPWWWARRQLPHNSAHYFRGMTLSNNQFIFRLRMIGDALWHELVALRSWGIFWYLVLVALLWPRRDRPMTMGSFIILSAVSLQAAAYLYTYLIYGGDISLLLPITLERLMLHAVGPLMIALAWRLEEPQKL